MDNEKSDRELLAVLRTDRVAFGQFYRRHVDGVIGFAGRRLSEPADVADLVSNTFLAVLTSAGSFDPERGEPRAWLYGIASRQVSNLRRRRRRESEMQRRLAGRRHLDVDDYARLEERIDERFEDRLLDSFMAEYDGLTAEPSRRLPAVGRGAVWAGGLAGALAVAAVVAIGAGWSGGSAPAASGSATGAPPGAAANAEAAPRFEDAAYVVGQVKKATGQGARAMIEGVSSHAPDSETGEPTWTQSWTVPGLDRTYVRKLDAAGKPISASILTTTGGQIESTLIDYGSRTWATLETAAPNAEEPGPAPAPAGPVADLQELTASGMRVVGRPTVDGAEAIELRSELRGTLTLWVDAHSYLPIREASTEAGGNPANPTITNEYTWAPATAKTLSALDGMFAVPAGFTKVSPEAEIASEAEG